MNRIRKIFLPLLTFSVLILLWWSIVSFSGIKEALLPSPLSVWDAFIEVASSGILFKHILASLFRVAVGFLSATIVAIPLGLLLGTRKYLHEAFDPILQVMRTISPISWIPLAILWFGIGDTPAIFIIFITAFFPILISTALSIKHIDPILIKVGTNFGASKSQLLWKIILPAISPYIIIGLKISLGISWVIIVAAEMVGMSSGLGYMILDARNFLRTDLIIAGMFVVGIIGFLLDRSLNLIELKVKRLVGFTS